MSTGERLFTPDEPNDAARSGIVLADGATAYVSGLDGRARPYDLDTGEVGDPLPPLAAELEPINGGLFASGTDARLVAHLVPDDISGTTLAGIYDARSDWNRALSPTRTPHQATQITGSVLLSNVVGAAVLCAAWLSRRWQADPDAGWKREPARRGSNRVSRPGLWVLERCCHAGRTSSRAGRATRLGSQPVGSSTNSGMSRSVPAW